MAVLLGLNFVSHRRAPKRWVLIAKNTGRPYCRTAFCFSFCFSHLASAWSAVFPAEAWRIRFSTPLFYSLSLCSLPSALCCFVLSDSVAKAAAGTVRKRCRFERFGAQRCKSIIFEQFSLFWTIWWIWLNFRYSVRRSKNKKIIFWRNQRFSRRNFPNTGYLPDCFFTFGQKNGCVCVNSQKIFQDSENIFTSYLACFSECYNVKVNF